MNRRDFLRATPIMALTPVAVAEGVARYELKEGGHFVFFIDNEKVNIEDLVKCPGIMPRGATGGWVIPVYGNPEEALKIFRLNGHPDDPAITPDMYIGKPVELKNG